MPSYFAGFEIVAQTKNFLVTCVSDAEARSRAQSVAGICEADLATLNGLFSTNFEVGNTSDHTIWVNVLKDDQTSKANGWNYGYETEESSRIVLQRAFVPPPPQPPPKDPPVFTPPNFSAAVIEFPRFVFVAELAEILMSFTGYGWNAGDSMGEGLSNLLGALLHPVGYYDALAGPRINQWLDGGGGPPPNPARASNFITNTIGTDRDQFSYGCAILFLNYLVSQLGFPLQRVIREKGSTLADTYVRLTGQTNFLAVNAFQTLLTEHLGTTTGNNLRRDNIFPLYPPNLRHVEITPGEPIETQPATDVAPVMFEVKPGIVCPAAPFAFNRRHQQVEQVVYARARGMANASFRWFIEGIEVPVRGQWTNFVVNRDVTLKNPDGGTQLFANALQIQYAIADAWNGSAIYLQTLSTEGNCSMDVSVKAQESAVKGGEVSASDEVSLITVEWIPGEDIKRAWQRCNPFYAAVDKSLWGLTAALSDFKNRPDPPSERMLVNIAEAVHRIDAAVGQFAQGGHMTPKEAWKTVGRRGFRSAQAPPQPVVNRTEFARASTRTTTDETEKPDDEVC